MASQLSSKETTPLVDQDSSQNNSNSIIAEQEVKQEASEQVLSSTPAPSALCGMMRHTDAVVDGDVAYFTTCYSKQIFAFNLATEKWVQLPDCTVKDTTLSVINGRLTAIGGADDQSGPQNNLYVLTGRGENRKWVDGLLPPMPTKRFCVVAILTGNALIVIGGRTRVTVALREVEVLNTKTNKWAKPTYLPYALTYASAALCNGHIYVNENSPVFTCSLTDLIDTCRPKIFEGQTSRRPRPIWTEIAHQIYYYSVFVNDNGKLLAIGGVDSRTSLNLSPTTNISKYDPQSNSWQTVGQLDKPRARCFAVVFPSKIMVVGGCTAPRFEGRTNEAEYLTRQL